MTTRALLSAGFEALDAPGQNEQAQTPRWKAFEERLSSKQPRIYLRNLPDFDDFETEERAMKMALASETSRQHSTSSGSGRTRPELLGWC